MTNLTEKSAFNENTSRRYLWSIMTAMLPSQCRYRQRHQAERYACGPGALENKFELVLSVLSLSKYHAVCLLSMANSRGDVTLRGGANS